MDASCAVVHVFAVCEVPFMDITSVEFARNSLHLPPGLAAMLATLHVIHLAWGKFSGFVGSKTTVVGESANPSG
jgi:hypothetical protein